MLIDRGRVDKVMQNNTNVLVDDIKALKTMFNGVANLGFPFLCDGNSEIYSKEEYMNTLNRKRNEEPMEKLKGIINGDQYLKRLRPSFHIWTRMKNIFKEMASLTYERHSEAELALHNIKDNSIVVGKYWKLIVRYHIIYLPPQ